MYVLMNICMYIQAIDLYQLTIFVQANTYIHIWYLLLVILPLFNCTIASHYYTQVEVLAALSSFIN